MKHVLSGWVALGLTLSLIGQAKADYTYTTLDPPGSILTYARAINTSGQIVGDYTDTGRHYHSYLLDVDGTYTTLDPPGAIAIKVHAINASGQIVGDYADTGAQIHGFLATPN